MQKFAELLAPQQVERVHDASLEILGTIGLLVRSEKARACFARHGCQVDNETHLVRTPRRIVEEFCAAFPPAFTFYGRDPQYDRTIPNDGPLVTTGSAAPDIVDPTTGQVRRARSDDIARIAFLVNELPGYDLLTVPITADDAPPGQFHLSRYYSALRNCLKPVLCSAPSLDEAETILRLGALIAGGETAYRQRPFMTYISCPVVSPLTLDVNSTEAFMHFNEQGFPVYGVVAPNAGMTAPLTLMGALAQANAEFLAQALLSQMARPGAPLIYFALPTVADMRTGAYAPGAIETGILLMGCAQMARYYGLPCGGYVGLTNAKLNDAQAGFEMGMPPLAALLGGLDLMNLGCLLDALMAFDYATAMIGGEIGQMLKRVVQGFETFDEHSLPMNVFTDVGPGGTFIDSQHTLERSRTTALLPQLADRLPRSKWQVRGSLDIHARAMQRAREILARDNPAVFSPDVDARIRDKFKNLVAGDATPEGMESN